MKPFLFAIFLLFPFAGYAQEADSLQTGSSRKVTSLIDLKDVWESRTNYFDNKFRGHWAGVQLGFNTFFDEDYTAYAGEEFMAPRFFKSSSVYINPVQFSLGLQTYRNTIGLLTGVGLEFQNLRIDKNTTLEKSPSGIVQPRTITEYKENIKSKLASSYLVVPLLLEVQVPIQHKKNRLFLSVGMIGKMHLASHTKITFRSVEDKKQKLKYADRFNINKYTYSLYIKTGNRWLKLFADIGFVPLFESDNGPEIYPVTFGLMLMSW